MRQPSPRPSPPWGTATRLLVAGAMLVVLAAALIRFRGVIPLLVLAGIVAYVMLPPVRWLHRRARLSWRLSTNLAFLYLLLLLIAAFTAAGLAVIQQFQAMFFLVQRFVFNLPSELAALSQQTVLIGPWEVDFGQFDLQRLGDQALGALQPMLGRVSGLVTSLATTAVGSLARLAFVLAVAYFATLDYDRLQRAWEGWTVPGYEQDLAQIRSALGLIWNAFLRGQLILAVVIGIVVTAVMSALGVRFALVLGVVAGVLEFVPIFGPIVAGTLAVLVAFFQGSNWWDLNPWTFALIVALASTAIQQLENNLLVPRILGTSLNLHPVIVLIGAIVGASLLGVIGLLLSAPAMATLRLLALYSLRKMFDLPPWDPPIHVVPQPRPRGGLRLGRKRRHGAEGLESANPPR